MLIDSNLIIDSARPDCHELRQFISDTSPSVSAISVVEVLGFHKLSEIDEQYFEEFFDFAYVHPVDVDVIFEAVRLRQGRNMSLGDAIIAATALVSDGELATRNVQDFSHIPGLQLFNPFEMS